jgi:RimJ/RimL family protein N-acetyltransferase
VAPHGREGAVLRLVGERCVVRPWTRADVESLVRHANNNNVARHLRDRFPHPYTKAHAVAFLADCVRTEPPSSLAIEVEGEAVGGIGYVRGTDVERYSAEVGYWLGEDHWNRGIVTEPLRLLTTHLFEEVQLLRLFAVPLAGNDGSIRVLEKAGYAREGLLRASCVKFGAACDQLLFATVNPRWLGPTD